MTDPSKSDQPSKDYIKAQKLAESAAKARESRTKWSPTTPPVRGKTPGINKSPTNVMLSPGDRRMLEDIQDHLSIGMGEAVRTAIRVYAAILSQQRGS